MKPLAPALIWMCFYMDPIKPVSPNPLEQLVERLRMEPTKAKLGLPASYPLFPRQK